jgi:hypothetical protein
MRVTSPGVGSFLWGIPARFREERGRGFGSPEALCIREGLCSVCGEVD